MNNKRITDISVSEETVLSDAYSTVFDGNQTMLAEDVYQTRMETQKNAKQEEAFSDLFQVGDFIEDRYEVLTVHHGAFSVVYGTFDHEEELPRALKTYQKKFSGNEEIKDLFYEEAVVWIKLEKHPYITKAYSVKLFGNQPYIITEYIKSPYGNDLRSWLGQSKITMEMKVEISLKIAQGMQHVQTKIPGMVHRDLKPANILVDKDFNPYVTDFGLVYATGSDAGTPAYMAPEQWNKEPVSIHTDIYAYGCILYEIFTGHRMFAATELDEWKEQHQTIMPVSPNQVNSEVPEEISQFILKCLCKEKVGRPKSWDEVVTFLANCYYQMTGRMPVLDFSSYSLDFHELFNSFNSLIHLNKYAEALKVAKRMDELEPDSTDSLHAFGFALLGLKRYEEALEYYNKVLDSNPYRKELENEKGFALLNLERYEEAMECFDKEIDNYPNSEHPWNNKGRCFHKLKRYEEALKCFDTALTIDPNSYTSYIYKFDTLLETKRYEEALNLCDNALKVVDKKDAFVYCKGLIYCHLKQYKEAEKYLRDVISRCPDDWEAFDRISEIYEESGKIEESLEIHRDYLQKYPERSDAWNSMGVLLNNFFDRNLEALECFIKASELKPQNALYCRNRVTSLVTLKRYEEALQYVKERLVLNPNDYHAINDKACIYYEMGYYQESEEAGRKSVKIKPNDRGFLYIGTSLAKKEEYKSALKYLDQSIELKPDSITALTEKAGCLRNLGRNKKAIEVYNDIVKYEPDNDNTVCIIGLLEYSMEKYKNAIKTFDKCLVMNPYKEDAWIYKCKALESLDKNEEVVNCCDSGLEKLPGNIELLECKGSALHSLYRNMEALECFDKVLEIVPNRKSAWFGKVDTLISLRQLFNLIPCYRKLIELDPTDYISVKALATLLSDFRIYREASDCIDKAMELKPDETFLHYLKSKALTGAGEYEEAVRFMRKALEFDEMNTRVWQYMAVALYKLNSSEAEFYINKRLAYFDEMLAESSNYITMNAKAYFLYEIERYEEAVECCEQALNMNPNFDCALDTMAIALDGLGRYQEAEEYSRRSLKIDSKNEEHLGNLGMILYHLKRYEEAMESCDNSIKLNGKNATAWMYKGLSLRKLNQEEEAKCCLNKALEIHPNLVLDTN